MSVRYKKVMGKGVGSPVANKWYGRAVSMGRVKTADLAEEISHSTTVTRADIMAVLIELTQVMKKHLQNSMTVELDGLGDFRVGLKTKVADKAHSLSSRHPRLPPDRQGGGYSYLPPFPAAVSSGRYPYLPFAGYPGR